MAARCVTHGWQMSSKNAPALLVMNGTLATAPADAVAPTTQRRGAGGTATVLGQSTHSKAWPAALAGARTRKTWLLQVRSALVPGDASAATKDATTVASLHVVVVLFVTYLVPSKLYAAYWTVTLDT